LLKFPVDSRDTSFALENVLPEVEEWEVQQEGGGGN
jgi:hypothetical protein